MTFRIEPKPPKGSGAYQQAVDLKRTLEAGGWPASLTTRGPTPEHLPLMSALWHIAYQRNGGVTTLSFDGHEIVFSCIQARNGVMTIAVDDFDIPWESGALRIMLDCREVTSGEKL